MIMAIAVAKVQPTLISLSVLVRIGVPLYTGLNAACGLLELNALGVLGETID